VDNHARQAGTGSPAVDDAMLDAQLRSATQQTVTSRNGEYAA